MTDPDVAAQFAAFNDGLPSLADPTDEATPEVTPESAAAPTEEVDTAAEGTTDRPRDEHGRFTSQQQETEQQEQERLYAGKYKTVEEMEAAYAHLNQMTGRQSAELGELRSLVESIPETIQQQQAHQQHSSIDVEALMLEDPAAAAYVAYENGDGIGLQRALAHWNELAPGAPAVWVQQMQAREAYETRIQELEARLDQVAQGVQPVAEAELERQRTSIFNQGYALAAQQNPDILNYAEAIAQVADERPHLVDQLNVATPDRVAAIISDLYAIAAFRTGRTSDTPTGQQQGAPSTQDVLRTAQQDAELAKQQAAVISGGGTPPPEPPKGVADQMWDAWASFDIARLR